MKQIGFFLIILTFVLVACKEMPNAEGTVVGLATVLPTTTETATKIAAATPTLPPSTPTPRLPTHMPTISPTITPTPIPTLIPATPFPSPANYTLRSWTEQDALDLIALFNWQWQQYSQNNEWRIPDDEDNYAMFHFYLAFFKKETLWRFPNFDQRSDLLWDIALDLAVAGEQEASLRLLPLIEQELNAQNTDKPSVTFLNTRGFTFDLITVENLLGDNQTAWILILSQEQSPFINEVGAAFSIRQTAGGYSVAMINSFWVPYLGNGFSVMVAEHTGDVVPEVIIERKVTIGTGPPFNYGSICVYQWNETTWISILNGSDNKPCIGHWEPGANPLPIKYVPGETNNTEQIEITSTINPAT